MLSHTLQSVSSIQGSGGGGLRIRHPKREGQGERNREERVTHPLRKDKIWRQRGGDQGGGTETQRGHRHPPSQRGSRDPGVRDIKPPADTRSHTCLAGGTEGVSQAWQSLDTSSATLPGQQPKHPAPEETVSGPLAAHLPYPATRGRPEAGKEKGGQQGSGSPAASWCSRSQLQETTPFLQPCSAPGPRAQSPEPRLPGSQGPRAEEQEQSQGSAAGRAGTVCPPRERPGGEARARRPE